MTPNSKLPLEGAFADPDAKRRYTRQLFATIADRYDLITVLLSFGRDRHWKRRLVALSPIAPGVRVLDLACGTGDLLLESARRGATVTGLDITPRMIELARRKAGQTPVSGWIAADMAALPLTSESFDVVTTGYGLRNVPDLPLALSEIHRVLRPGGTICSLDFDRPEAKAVSVVFRTYLTVVGSGLGWLLHRDIDTYRYIPASIRRYPGARGVCQLMERAGFLEVRHLPVFGGFMAMHFGRKVSRPGA